MKTSTLLSVPALLAMCLAIPSSVNATECPSQLLWSNGVVWAYRAVKCESPTKCNVPTETVLMYNHSVANLGCGGENCICNLSDADNDFLGYTAVAGGNLPPIHTTAPNNAVQNGSCSFIDDFNVPVTGTQTYFQCVEFRFRPDPAGPERNMRIAIQLTATPTTSLINENVTYDNAATPKKLVRVVNGKNIDYEIIRSGQLTLPAMPGAIPGGGGVEPDTVNPPTPDN